MALVEISCRTCRWYETGEKVCGGCKMLLRWEPVDNGPTPC